MIEQDTGLGPSRLRLDKVYGWVCRAAGRMTVSTDTGENPRHQHHRSRPWLLAKPAHRTRPMAPETTNVSRHMRHMSRDITGWSLRHPTGTSCVDWIGLIPRGSRDLRPSRCRRRSRSMRGSTSSRTLVDLNRTPLTEKEVEAIRTARAGGESVLSVAKRFGIHRATVWEHTKSSQAK